MQNETRKWILLVLVAAGVILSGCQVREGVEAGLPEGRVGEVRPEAPEPQPIPEEEPAVAEVPPLEAEDTPGTLVVLDTDKGEIVLSLFLAEAPETNGNFLTYVEQGFYDGTLFHRVIPGFMIQGGGFTEAMVQKPTNPPIRNESDNGLRNLRGTVAMARTSDPDSATAQFFINLVDNPFLDAGGPYGGYAVFAEVVEGMEVVDAIAEVPTTTRPPHQNVPVEPVRILQAYRLPAGAGSAGQ
ncbi:MAG: peptidyl-prolyl cis-trans isomerase [Puniceicoccaceae bacterium]|nr:MAG: peptidyl-prolyl cis-trans isomerase [Puniceicoccaceae bacterium]